MKKIIGIITRPVLDRLTINREVSDVVLDYNCLPLGIIPLADEGRLSNQFFEDQKQLLSLCDGVILQGGLNYYEYDLEIVRYLYEHDIPTLGICLGMQTMSVFKNGVLGKIKEETHLSDVDYVHPVIIQKDSKLYSLIQKETILVNSRHREQVTKTDLCISAHAPDGIIEAVEDPKKKFFVGVEWHPESIADDCSSQQLFQAFFDAVNGS